MKTLRKKDQGGRVLSRALLLTVSAAVVAPGQQPPSDLVNPLVGTAADGQTYPAAGTPFGMTQWTPQTSAGEAKCLAPYYFADTHFQGIRGSHFLSGSCTQDYGSLTIMPLPDANRLGAQHWGTPYTHAGEHATPYRYTVDLPETHIRAEATGTERCGLLRFHFSQRTGWLGIEDNIRKGTGSVRIDAARGEVTGVNPVTRIYQGNGKPAGFSGYFVLQFSRPFAAVGTWTAAAPQAHGAVGEARRHAGRLQQQARNGPAGAYLSFALPPDGTLTVRVGTSFTSLDEARKNLAAEVPDFDFDRASGEAQQTWDLALGKAVIAGNSPARRVFYTALYHSLQLPRIFSDRDGSYPRFAGGAAVEHAQDFTYYTDYSLWDTFRALHPLLALVEPKRAGDMVRSLLAMGDQGGFLPIFPAWNSYTSEMIGDHADAVIADAYSKNIGGFDPEHAYQLMRRNALETPAPAVYRAGLGRRALPDYLHLGFIPVENPVRDAYHRQEQVSRTLEYAYDDSLVAGMAAALGHSADAELFRKRAGNWRNVFDPATGFMRGKHRDGRWVSPADPATKQTWITEGLPFQYTFFVPQDLPGARCSRRWPRPVYCEAGRAFRAQSLRPGQRAEPPPCLSVRLCRRTGQSPAAASRVDGDL